MPSCWFRKLRMLLSRFLRRGISQLKVIAHAEVPENKIIKVTSIIGGKEHERQEIHRRDGARRLAKGQGDARA
jgi:hypothetical protein